IHTDAAGEALCASILRLELDGPLQEAAPQDFYTPMAFRLAGNLLLPANPPGFVSAFSEDPRGEMLLRAELEPADFRNGKNIAKKRVVLPGHGQNEVFRDLSQITPQQAWH